MYFNNFNSIIADKSLRMLCKLDNMTYKCSKLLNELGYKLIGNIVIPSNEIRLGDKLFTTNTKKPFDVYYNDEVVNLRGISSKIPGAVAVLSSTNVPIIVVNTALLKEPKWFIATMIMHAIGHIVLHFDGCNLECDMSSILSIITTQRYEYEADEYAFDNGVDMLKALRHLQSLGYNVQRRIRNLELVCIEYGF